MRLAAVFDRATKLAQRQLAARNVPLSRQVDYLRDEVASRVADRLLDIRRSFPRVLDIGAHAGHLRTHVDPDSVHHIDQIDSASSLLMRDAHLNDHPDMPPTTRIVADEEGTLMEGQSNVYDAAISSMALHWINDLPATLRHINRLLKPDAPFIAAMPGGDTLFELRCSLQLAETNIFSRVAPHVSPMVAAADLSGLLADAGFALTTIDVDEIVVNYPDMFALLDDLQAMGESSCAWNRPSVLSRDVLMAASAIYQQVYGQDGDNGPSIPATFQIFYMIGWKPDKGKKPMAAPKPVKPIVNNLDLNPSKR